jgi:hypothetical protein
VDVESVVVEGREELEEDELLGNEGEPQSSWSAGHREEAWEGDEGKSRWERDARWECDTRWGGSIGTRRDRWDQSIGD